MEPTLRRRILGIDPGLTGAVAVLDLPRGEPPMTYVVHDTPTTVVQLKGRRKRHEYVVGEMHKILVNAVLDHSEDLEILAVIEAQSPRPQEGTVSSFRTGYGLGVWHALLTVTRIPYRVVMPSKWKKDEGMIGQDKNYSRFIASQRFPLAELSRNKDHGRAEALLIADYARRQNW